MDKRFWFTFSTILVLLTILAFYLASFKTYRWNQRLTVTILTPDGEKTASSVTGIGIKTGPYLLKDAVCDEFFGEPLFFELDGKVLFALGYESSAFDLFWFDNNSNAVNFEIFQNILNINISKK